MSESERYNGWRNRATWLFSLWFADSMDVTTVIRDGMEPEEMLDAVETYARETWEEAIDELSLPNWLTDFLDDDIDFREVAESLCEDLEKE